MATEERQSMFPNARIRTESWLLSPQGSGVWTNYVDLSGEDSPRRLCLVKAAEPQFELANASSIRLSRPGVFRDNGEVLIKDEHEGRARIRTKETVERPNAESGLVEQRMAALTLGLTCQWQPKTEHFGGGTAPGRTHERVRGPFSPWYPGRGLSIPGRGWIQEWGRG